MLERSGERSYATPESSTAILTPFPPGRPAAIRLSHARGASTPVPGRKFHWSFCQPPGVDPVLPGAFGIHALAGAASAKKQAMVSSERTHGPSNRKAAHIVRIE